MRVQVAVALAHAQEVTALELAPGATLADALAAARVAERHPGLALDCVGIWGRVRDAATPLREGDRVEVYRALRADAKQMRRARAGLSRPSRSRSAP